MSLAAVRNLTVVSFLVIGGLLISASIYAATAPYIDAPWTKIEAKWGTTFDDQPGNYNKGMFFALWVGPDNPNRDYGEMPQEDTTYIHELNAPFNLAQTSWSATTADNPTQFLQFATFDDLCNPQTAGGAIYAMNDTDHLYLALILQAEGIDSADFVGLYFDPDNVGNPQKFIVGSGVHYGTKLGDVTMTEGVGNVVNEEMAFCNGHWMDWDNSGSIDVWEYGYPWPYIGAFNAMKYPMENFTGDKEDLTICPRNASLWGDGSGTYPLSGAYWANNTAYPWQGQENNVIMLQYKIPLEQFGCSIALGSTIGFAIEWLDDKGVGTTGITPCTSEVNWFPQNIENSGPVGWDEYDATYMGQLILNSQNIGNRLWGPWFDIRDDRTTYLVLKNVSDEETRTRVKFYGAKFGDAEEIYAPLPGAGMPVFENQCITIPPHGVSTLQLETLGTGMLRGERGCIEVTNTNLAGYVVSYVGIDSGAIQTYAWSVDLQLTPLTPAEWNTIHSSTSVGMMLANKWYIVDEPGFDFDTSVVVMNPSSSNSVTAKVVVYPAVYSNPATPGTPNLCADTGFHPDFNLNYNGTSLCGDITGDAGDVINIPSHQAVEIKMWEFLNQWVAPYKPGVQPWDFSQDITDPTNQYWHFRKGTMEIFVYDGDDAGNTTRVDESLIGITARESIDQGWAENCDRYYE